MDSVQVYARPKYSFVYLIALAINNNMEKEMSLKEIYEYIMENYPFYRHPESGRWKASIRHTLSTNDCFVRKNVNCKRSVWALHPDSIGMFEGGTTIRRKKQFRAKCWHDNYMGNIEKDRQMSKQSTSVPTSHDIPQSIPFGQYLKQTESSQCQWQVTPGAYGLYDFSKSHTQEHEGEDFKMQSFHDQSYQLNCNNTTVENISKSIPLSTFEFQFPESQATNNPNMFQFQQKTPSMSTVAQDVVNFDPIWPPQIQLNNVLESPVVTSQNRKTDNCFHSMDKISEVNKIQLDNMSRVCEVAEGSKAYDQGEIESLQWQLQFNSMPETNELDQPQFSISTLPTSKGQSDYTCHDSFSIPSSILFPHYLTESPQPQCQVMPGMHGLNDSTLQATNNPNPFQFQQKMPSRSTIPWDVVNFHPIWSPQVQCNNVPESRYEEDTYSENYL